MADRVRQPPAFSPVDYDAWSRGYMPPSEHVLIDALHLRGAKVEMSCNVGREEKVWIVYQGKGFGRKARRHLMRMMQELDAVMDDEDEPAPPVPAQTDGDA